MQALATYHHKPTLFTQMGAPESLQRGLAALEAASARRLTYHNDAPSRVQPVHEGQQRAHDAVVDLVLLAAPHLCHKVHGQDSTEEPVLKTWLDGSYLSHPIAMRPQCIRWHSLLLSMECKPSAGT